MNPIKRFLDYNRARKAGRVAQELRNQLYLSPICSDYENVFAQVRPMIDEMKTVRPYGVGRNGAKLDRSRTPELNLLDDPNDDMGWVDFADAMFATWLTKDQLYIHTHWKGNSLIGYTILPSNSKVCTGTGLDYWQVQNADGETIRLYKDEVMTLRFSRNPDNLNQGVSPASAVRIYAQVDDLVAQFQKAYFENGAVPATITFITASTEDNYRKVRYELEHNLKGAANRNKTVYAWRQMLPETGQTADQIEVKTIQGNNNSQAIGEIVKVINDRLNKAYGVSNFILGDDSSAKYDNAELSDHQFTKRRVYPALLSFWNQFQHELDRITGGLGYGIQFDLEIPELTERTKVKAEIAEKNVKNLKDLIESGSKPAAAVKALKLGEDWLSVAAGIYNRVLADREIAAYNSTQENKNSLDITNTQDMRVQDASSQSSCHECQHHSLEATTDYYQPFTDDEKAEKLIFDKLMALARAIFAEDPKFNLEQYQDEIYELIKDEANKGSQEALDALRELAESPELAEEIENLIKNGYDISEGLSQRLHERTNQLVQGFDTHTRELMRGALESEEPLTANEIEERLAKILPDGKAATIARNETVYAFKSGRLDLDKYLAKKYDLQIELIWRTSHDNLVCDVCQAMDGQITRLGRPFKDQVNTDDGVVAWEHSEWNDNGEIPDAHVNCVLGDTIVKADSVKLATKMNYSGDIVELKTLGGKRLAVTPNHILLTDRGWVAAKNIKKTDKVITYSDSVERAMANDTIDGKNPTIADEFVALSKTPGVVAIEVPVTAEDFKGDGIANEKIEVILAESLLRNKRDAASIKLGGKLPFVGGKFTDGTLFGLGSIDQLLVGVLLAANGIVGSTGKALTFLGSEGGHPEISRLTSATAYNARLNEAAANSSTADIEAFSKSFLAEAGLIKFDDVIDIKIYSVHNAPVYDVETTSTLYTANGIISSNCRCYFDERIIRTEA